MTLWFTMCGAAARSRAPRGRVVVEIATTVVHPSHNQCTHPPRMIRNTLINLEEFGTDYAETETMTTLWLRVALTKSIDHGIFSRSC